MLFPALLHGACSTSPPEDGFFDESEERFFDESIDPGLSSMGGVEIVGSYSGTFEGRPGFIDLRADHSFRSRITQADGQDERTLNGSWELWGLMHHGPSLRLILHSDTGERVSPPTMHCGVQRNGLIVYGPGPDWLGRPGVSGYWHCPRVDGGSR